MNDFIKGLLKWVFTGIVWVFILSINWDGRSMFYHANDIFVKNAVVDAIDEELAQVWGRVRNTAKSGLKDEEEADSARSF